MPSTSEQTRLMEVYAQSFAAREALLRDTTRPIGQRYITSESASEDLAARQADCVLAGCTWQQAETLKWQAQDQMDRQAKVITATKRYSDSWCLAMDERQRWSDMVRGYERLRTELLAVAEWDISAMVAERQQAVMATTMQAVR